MPVDFWIDAESAAGAKIISGPITSVMSWRYHAAMDRVGDFSFEIPPTEPHADTLTYGRIVRAWALIDGVVTELGAGIVERNEISVGTDGIPRRVVTGSELMRELTYRSVGFLEIGAGGVNNSFPDTLAAITALLPPGWTLDDADATAYPYVYARFAGESVLSALIKLSEAHKVHFRRGTGRVLEFYTSGVPDTITWDVLGEGRITSLEYAADSSELLTRIYPFGAGNGQARLDIGPTDRTAPTGYTMGFQAGKGYYIENDDFVEAFGIIERPLEYKNISPIVNTTQDIIAAANALFDLAYEELRRRTENVFTPVYSVKLADVTTLLRPGDWIHAAYRDLDANIDVDEVVEVLESTISLGPDGLRTTDCVISTRDRRPQTDAEVTASSMEQGSVFQAHPQLNANSYCIAYTKNMDAGERAEFRFRFNDEITQLVRVQFDFQILPLESTVKSIGSQTTITETQSTSTSSGGPTTVGLPVGFDPDIGLPEGFDPDIGVEPGDEESGPAEGGDTESGLHHHFLNIIPVADTSSYEVVYIDTAAEQLYTVGAGDSLNPGTTNRGDHVHNQEHTHGIEHVHDITHSHDITHEHDISHTHTFVPVIDTVYGIHRDELINTLSLANIEYSLDTVTWYDFEVDVNGYAPLGDGWHRVDLSELLWEPITFRPSIASNLLRFRSKIGTFDISTINGTVTTTTVTTAADISGLVVGQSVTIDGTVNYDGTFDIATIGVGTFTMTIARDSEPGSEVVGTVTPNIKATIDAQLSVVTIIQAISYSPA